MPDIARLVNRLALSGDEITSLTKWADSMVTDYLGIHESLLLVAEAFDSLETFSAVPTFNAGNGTIEGDTNATDWTGHDRANGTRLEITVTDSVIFSHGGVVYQYIGKKPVLLGVGGDYTTVNSDFVPIGTGDHDILNNRSLPDAHPISAITNLQSELNDKADQTSLDAHTGDGSIHFTETSIDHNNIQNIGTDTHAQLEARLVVLEDLIIQMSVAGYGGATQEANISFDIPVTTYITVPFDTKIFPTTERGFIVDLAAETFKFTVKGAWAVNVTFNLENITELNSSRTFNIRLFNVTDATAGKTSVVPVSRNQGDVLVAITFLVNIDATLVNKNFRLEVGGFDAVAGGDLVNASVSATQAAEIGALV